MGWRKAVKTKLTKKDEEKRNLRGGNLEVWDGAIVDDETTFLPGWKGFFAFSEPEHIFRNPPVEVEEPFHPTVLLELLLLSEDTDHLQLTSGSTSRSSSLSSELKISSSKAELVMFSDVCQLL